jgi:hypothetical protein
MSPVGNRWEGKGGATNPRIYQNPHPPSQSRPKHSVRPPARHEHIGTSFNRFADRRYYALRARCVEGGEEVEGNYPQPPPPAILRKSRGRDPSVILVKREYEAFSRRDSERRRVQLKIKHLNCYVLLFYNYQYQKENPTQPDSRV